MTGGIAGRSVVTEWLFIGWAYEIHIRGSVNPFYRAVGIHQASGRPIELERSTDRTERIMVIGAFWDDPMSRHQHFPRDLRG